MTLRVLICDDQALIRSGLRMILEAASDVEVVGEAGDGRQAVELAKKEEPDVVVMDVRMPEMDGIEATRSIVGNGINTRVLVLTTFDLDEYVYEAIRAGASGFLLKTAEAERLVDAVRTVAAGDALLAPSVTRRLLDSFAARYQQRAPLDGLKRLSEREEEVLKLMARGLSNAEIADQLVVSETTVKSHVSSVLRKLNVRDRVQAVVAAYEGGLAGV